MVAVLVPSRIALREHAERDPREREDVSGVVVRWMDQVDERERRRVPHSDRAVAFRGGGVSACRQRCNKRELETDLTR